MVDYYVEQIRNTQPVGPYSLLGWPMGGALAIDIAHRLESAGEIVEFVGLVDTSCPFPSALSGLRKRRTSRARSRTRTTTAA